eukprot:g2022.t1
MSSSDKILRQHRLLHVRLADAVSDVALRIQERSDQSSAVLLLDHNQLADVFDDLQLSLSSNEAMEDLLESLSPDLVGAIRLDDLCRLLICVEAPGIPAQLQMSPGREARPVTAYGNKGRPGSTQRRMGHGFGWGDSTAASDDNDSENERTALQTSASPINENLDEYRQQIFKSLLFNLKEQFEAVDFEGSGLLNIEQVATCLENLNLPYNDDELRQFMVDLGVDGGEQIISEQVVDLLRQEDDRYAEAFASQSRTTVGGIRPETVTLSLPPRSRRSSQSPNRDSSTNNNESERSSEGADNTEWVEEEEAPARQVLRPATVIVDMDKGMVCVDNSAKAMGGPRESFEERENLAVEDGKEMIDEDQDITYIDPGRGVRPLSSSTAISERENDKNVENVQEKEEVEARGDHFGDDEDRERDEYLARRERRARRAAKAAEVRQTLNNRMIWLARQCNALEQAHRVSQKEVQEAKKAARKWKAEFEDARDLAAEFALKYREAEEDKEAKLKRIDTLKRKLSQKERRNRGLVNELKSWDQKVISMQARGEHLKREASRWQDRYEKATARFKAEKKNMIRENSILKGQVEKNSEALVHQVKLIKGRVNLADAKADAACGKLGHWQHQADSLRRKLTELKEKAKQEREMMDAQLQKKEELRQQEVGEAQETLKIVTERLRKVEKDTAEKMKRIGDENEKLKISVDRKERQLVDAGELLDAWRFEKGDMQRMLREYEVKNARLEEKLETINVTLMKEMRLRQTAQREKCLHHVEAQDVKRRMTKMTNTFRSYLSKAGMKYTKKKAYEGDDEGIFPSQGDEDDKARALAAYEALDVKRTDMETVLATRGSRKNNEENEPDNGRESSTSRSPSPRRRHHLHHRGGGKLRN